MTLMLRPLLASHHTIQGGSRSLYLQEIITWTSSLRSARFLRTPRIRTTINHPRLRQVLLPILERIRIHPRRPPMRRRNMLGRRHRGGFILNSLEIMLRRRVLGRQEGHNRSEVRVWRMRVGRRQCCNRLTSGRGNFRRIQSGGGTLRVWGRRGTSDW